MRQGEWGADKKTPYRCQLPWPASPSGVRSVGLSCSRIGKLELELILSQWLWERGEKGGASLKQESASEPAVLAY